MSWHLCGTYGAILTFFILLISRVISFKLTRIWHLDCVSPQKPEPERVCWFESSLGHHSLKRVFPRQIRQLAFRTFRRCRSLHASFRQQYLTRNIEFRNRVAPHWHNGFPSVRQHVTHGHFKQVLFITELIS
jgi:hypothetical protein